MALVRPDYMIQTLPYALTLLAQPQLIKNERRCIARSGASLYSGWLSVRGAPQHRIGAAVVVAAFFAADREYVQILSNSKVEQSKLIFTPARFHASMPQLTVVSYSVSCGTIFEFI